MTVNPRTHTYDAVGRKLLKIADILSERVGYDYYVTSALRSGDTGSYHGGVLDYGGSEAAAIDIGFGYSTAGYQTRAKALAAALYAHSDLTVELIVSNINSGLNYADGYYVKNQRRVSPYAVYDHRNHIHFASSEALADKILARLDATPTPTPIPPEDGMALELDTRVPLPAWVVEAFKADPGIADGSIWVQTALGSGYGYARQANDRLAQVLTLLQQVLKTQGEHESATATRDAEIIALVRAVDAGELDAAEVVRLIGEKLTAPEPTP